MSTPRPGGGRWPMGGLVGLVLLLAAAVVRCRGDLIREQLDPKTPYQTYRPPPAPDYAQPTAWRLAPAHPEAPSASDPPADVFFVSPTTYEGGRQWNDPINDAKSDRLFRRVMAPNYAG